MFNKSLFMVFLLLTSQSAIQAKSVCEKNGVWLQVLGSGGPELNDGRASSGYVIWIDGKARVLIDMGAGSLLRFEQSGASLNDLDVLLFSHFHTDHSSDLPALIKASFFSSRDRDLPLYGPTGNPLMPSATEFVQALLARRGAFEYLNSYLDGTDSYRLKPHSVEINIKTPVVVLANSTYKISTVAVHHGPIPALAWRFDIGSKSLVFSGDMNNDNNTLVELAKQTDLLVAHHAISE